MNMLSCFFPFLSFPPVSLITDPFHHWTTSVSSLLLPPTPPPPVPFLSRLSAQAQLDHEAFWKPGSCKYFFSHLINYMSDSNLISVLAYVQAFFLNSENVDKWCVFADHTVSDSTYKMELFHDTALLSLEKIISCDMMLLGKELLYMVCKEGVINSLLLWNLFFSIVFFFL